MSSHQCEGVHDAGHLGQPWNINEVTQRHCANCSGVQIGQEPSQSFRFCARKYSSRFAFSARSSRFFFRYHRADAIFLRNFLCRIHSSGGVRHFLMRGVLLRSEVAPSYTSRDFEDVSGTPWDPWPLVRCVATSRV